MLKDKLWSYWAGYPTYISDAPHSKLWSTRASNESALFTTHRHTPNLYNVYNLTLQIQWAKLIKNKCLTWKKHLVRQTSQRPSDQWAVQYWEVRLTLYLLSAVSECIKAVLSVQAPQLDVRILRAGDQNVALLHKITISNRTWKMEIEQCNAGCGIG